MRNFLIIAFVIFAQQMNSQVELSEKIIGNWNVEHVKFGEKLAAQATPESSLGIIEKATIYFKTNNTGNFNFPDRDSEAFTWTVSKNKIIIVYSGTNEISKQFNGDFRAIYRERKGEQKLDLTRNGFSVVLSRKP